MRTPTYWIMHCHHDRLIEPARAPLAERIAFIKLTKPRGEQALRLRLIRKVPARLIPVWLRVVAAEYQRAEAALLNEIGSYRDELEVQHKYDAARFAYTHVLFDNQAALEELHKRLCKPDCPWNGRTIFPRGRK